ncbi:hypothetical protein AB0A69_20220 [Streptomyces sp. NPDC045431]|uniref:hypothetical protein n=1 Tax=Streptomyces sp. NPDC045431 TaxID=3155613 RepID=UPI0033EF1656
MAVVSIPRPRRARTVDGTAATAAVAAVAARPAGTATVLFLAVAAVLLFHATEVAVAVGWPRGSGRMRSPARATGGEAVPRPAAAVPVSVPGLDGTGAGAGPGIAAVPFRVRRPHRRAGNGGRATPGHCTSGHCAPGLVASRRTEPPRPSPITRAPPPPAPGGVEETGAWSHGPAVLPGREPGHGR